MNLVGINSDCYVFKRVLSFVLVAILLLMVLQKVDAEQKELESFFFPYHFCLRSTILDVRKRTHKPVKTWTSLIIKVRVEESYKGQCKPGEVVTLFVGNPPSDLLPQGAFEKLKGASCILAYSLKPKEFVSSPDLPRGALDVFRICAPFPGQKFTEADAVGLKSKILETGLRAVSKEALQTYLKRTWTVQRVRAWCRPETRHIPFIQLLTSSDWNGELYSEEECGVGKVVWRAKVYDEIPQMCSVLVISPSKDVWDLGTLSVNLTNQSFSDEDLIKARLASTLGNALMLYRYVHKSAPLVSPLYSWDTAQGQATSQLVYSGSCGPIFKVVADDGHEISATLDEDLSIKSVMVDGKVDSFWNKIMAEFCHNIDRAYKGEIK